MDISIIEFILYGLVGYSGVIFLIHSAFHDNSSTKSHSIARVVWLIPSMAAVFILAGSGVGINLDNPAPIVTEVYNNTGALITNSTTYPTYPTQIVLVNPMWILFHSMLGLILSIYIFTQFINLLGKSD